MTKQSSESIKGVLTDRIFFAYAVISPTYTICKRLRKFRIRKHVLHKDGSLKEHANKQTPLNWFGIRVYQLSLCATSSLDSSSGRSDWTHVLQGPATEPLMTLTDYRSTNFSLKQPFYELWHILSWLLLVCCLWTLSCSLARIVKFCIKLQDRSVLSQWLKVSLFKIPLANNLIYVKGATKKKKKIV